MAGAAAGIARPITAVLVGGPTKPYVFDATVAQTLIDLTLRSARATPGTMFVTTSRPEAPTRSSPALREGLPGGGAAVRVERGSERKPVPCPARPRRAVRGVTGDSISMMVEVAGLGRPLAIFPLPVGPGRIDAVRRFLAARLQPEAGWIGAAPRRPLHALDTSATRRARRAPRQADRKRPRGAVSASRSPPPAKAAPDDLPRVVERIRALF